MRRGQWRLFVGSCFQLGFTADAGIPDPDQSFIVTDMTATAHSTSQVADVELSWHPCSMTGNVRGLIHTTFRCNGPRSDKGSQVPVLCLR